MNSVKRLYINKNNGGRDFISSRLFESVLRTFKEYLENSDDDQLIYVVQDICAEYVIGKKFKRKSEEKRREDFHENFQKFAWSI